MTQSPETKEAWIQAALERYERPLVRYAAALTGDLETARDVVQDAFVKLCAAERDAVESHLAAWLYAVCRHRAYDVRKKEGRMQPIEGTQAEARPAPGLTPSESAAANETHALVFRAVKRLPENQQEAFRLKFNDQLSYREISEVLGVSLGTVSNWITAALGTVRAELTARGATPGEV